MKKKIIMLAVLLSVLLLALPNVLSGINVDYTSEYILNENIIHQIKENNSNYVKYNDFPIDLIIAVTATEDKRFFEHEGYDLVAIARAFVNDIKAKKFKEGGSTITQQLAKNLFLTREKTIERKVKELILATKIEKLYTKSEILEMYLNAIYYGDGKHGVGNAAINYFGEEPKNLNLDQCAILAGIPQSPNKYNPKINPEETEKRKNMVLNLIEKNTKEASVFSKTAKLAKIYPKMKKIRFRSLFFSVNQLVTDLK